MDRPYTPVANSRRKKNLGLSTREYAKVCASFTCFNLFGTIDASKVTGTIASVRKSRHYEEEFDEDLVRDVQTSRGGKGKGSDVFALLELTLNLDR